MALAEHFVRLGSKDFQQGLSIKKIDGCFFKDLFQSLLCVYRWVCACVGAGAHGG